MSYHNNTIIGLTAWSSKNQAYMLIPFDQVREFFQTLSVVVEVPLGLVDTAYQFMAEYSPEQEVVLLTQNEDLLTVAVLRKDLRPSKEALAEQLGWSLEKFTAFEYIVTQTANQEKISMTQELLGISDKDYDTALGVLYA